MAVAVGCNPETPPPPTTPPADFEISDTYVELGVGDTKTLTVSGNEGQVSWSSDASQIVSVDNGALTAKAVGVANITAIADGESLSCRVEVKECPSGASLLKINNSFIDYVTKTANVDLYSSSDISASLYVNGVYTQSDIAISSSDSEVISIANGKIVANKVGTAKLSATTTLNGTVYNSVEYTFTVGDNRSLLVDREEITLLTSFGINQNAVTENLTANISVYILGANGTKDLLPANSVEWVSADTTIATVENGLISSVSSGNTVVTAKYNGKEVSVNVVVAIPIFDIDDMDALGLVTYLFNKELATDFLSKNYVLMNDLDYSTRSMNWIIPIASVNGEFFNQLRSDISINGDISYYSRTWERVLGLSKAKVDSATILYTKTQQELDAMDENARKAFEFKGINPNNVAFSGTFDGNGHTIKNAWLLADNVLYTSGKTFGVGAQSFIGNLTGTLKNIAFDNLKIADNNIIIDYVNEETALTHTYNKNGSQLYAKDNPNALYATYAKENVDGTGADLYMKGYNGLIGTRVGRDQWGRRNGNTSALVLSNKGTIQNVYMTYTNTASTCSVTSAITLYNDGLIDSCVLVPVLEEYNDAACFDQAIGNPVAYKNDGVIRNVSVCHKHTTKQNYSSIYEDTGETVSLVTFASFDSLKAEPAYTSSFNPTYWDSAEMKLIANAYNFD